MRGEYGVCCGSPPTQPGGGLFALVKASPPGPPSRRRLHLDKVRLITVSPFSHVGLLPTDVT